MLLLLGAGIGSIGGYLGIMAKKTEATNCSRVYI